MGQALDHKGNVLGEATGATKQEVLEKLEREHPDAAEIRLRKQVQAVQDSIHTSAWATTRVGDFGAALEALREGKAVQRSGWNGKGMWLRLQTPDSGSKMTLPYIYMSTVAGDLVPWLASQSDVLATDWYVL